MKKLILIVNICLVFCSIDCELAAEHGAQGQSSFGVPVEVRIKNGELQVKDKSGFVRVVEAIVCPLLYLLYFFWFILCLVLLILVFLAEALTFFQFGLIGKLYRQLAKTSGEMLEALSFCSPEQCEED